MTRRHHRGCTRNSRRPTLRPLTLRTGADLQNLPPLVPLSRCPGGGKLRYSSIDDATAALANIDHHNPRRREQRVYLCPFCHGWHLTSQPPRRPAAELAEPIHQQIR